MSLEYTVIYTVSGKNERRKKFMLQNCCHCICVSGGVTYVIQSFVNNSTIAFDFVTHVGLLMFTVQGIKQATSENKTAKYARR